MPLDEPHGPAPDEEPVTPLLAAILEALPGIAAKVVTALGAVVLLAWFLDLPFIREVRPGSPRMMANTACGLSMAAIALWILGRELPPRWSQTGAVIAAVGVMLLGVMTTAEYATGIDLEIDRWLPHDEFGTLGTRIPGRPSLQTAVAFTLIGMSLLAMASKKPGAVLLSRACGLGAGLVAAVALVGHVYGAVHFYGVVFLLPYTGMALHTAAAFVFLASGVLCAQSQDWLQALLTGRGPDAALARRLLPAAVAIPLLAGAFAESLFQSAWLGLSTAFALAALLSVVAGIAVVAATVAALGRSELKRRKAEETLRANEQRYAEAYEREHEAAEQLRKLDEMKTTFLRAVSHELRTPLGVITNFAALLEESDETLDPLTVRDWISRIRRNSQQLERLLTDLLNLDRLSRGIIQANRRPTRIPGLVENVLAEIDSSSHSIEVAVTAGTLSIDPSQVERIIENLVINALRHTPAGTPIALRVTELDGGLLIIVEDSGPGVPDSMKEAIFEAFCRGVDARAPGTGIGLSLVADFAKLHGGRAWVEDRPGGGSSFRVHLPAWPSREGLRVLVVDWDGGCQLGKAGPNGSKYGFNFVHCGGPGKPPVFASCPLVDGLRCSVAEGADAIVVRLMTADPRQIEVIQAYRKHCPQTPIVVEAPKADRENFEKLLRGCTVVSALPSEKELGAFLGELRQAGA